MADESRLRNDSGVQTLSLGLFVINQLPTKKLSRPLSAILERDGDGYIACLVDLPLYGYDEDAIGAIDNLKAEIESLYDDLMEDDNFSPEWLGHKEFLKSIISE